MSNQSDLPLSTGRLNSEAINGIASRSEVFERFETIAGSDYRWFYSFALRIAKNHHDAEDAVQDAFLSAYQHLGDLQSPQKLGSWIASIVLNHARMQYRVKNRFAFSFDEKMNGENETCLLDVLRDTSTSPEDCYAVTELYARVSELIATLPSKLRQTFLMRRVQGLSTAETADVLGINRRLVRVRFSRASARLKALLARRIAGSPRRLLSATAKREFRRDSHRTSSPQLPRLNDEFKKRSISYHRRHGTKHAPWNTNEETVQQLPE
jgi:RNA polymerase sigma-70 factor, ECF subfamily